MATEIERKFLVKNESWRSDADGGTPIRQGYIVGGAAATVRVRLSGERAWLSIKSATVGVTRGEFNYEIPCADAACILETLCTGTTIEKVRFVVRYAGHDWEIDVFEGENDGLVLAEIELQSEGEAFERPAWAGKEVSDDPRYYNSALAECPYRRWKR
ncbi:MAG: CYTH domain-containing protein [Gammaproteobacteria bacterium]|nr:CYTH domain-containing protein [Gammaproteobacteria bacterium]